MRSPIKSALKLAVAFLLPCACAHPAFGQLDSHPNTISVSGDAQINVIPDKVSITLGVETVHPSLDTAKAANDASSARILAVTQAFEISPKDVQTDYINIEPRYDRDQRGIIGYSVHKSLVVTLRDVPRFDAFLTAAVNAGANNVLGIQFLTSDLRKYRDQARDMAIKAAREKANALASALGQKAGKALTINEQQEGSWSFYNSGWARSNSNNFSQNVASNASSSDPGESGAGDTTAPGQTKVHAAVQVVFQLLD